MPFKDQTIETELKNRFFNAMRYIIADYDTFRIKNRSAFTKKIGWNPGNLSRAETSEDFYVPVQYMIAIVKKCNISAHWMLTGEGEMFSEKLEKKKRS